MSRKFAGFRSWARQSRNRYPDSSPQRLGLEQLEARMMLSDIVWTNRGSNLSDRDGLEAVFGNNVAMARTVIDQVIEDWESVIDSFNYQNVGQKGWAPVNYYQLRVGAKDWQSEPENTDTLARGGIEYTSNDGRPWSGTLTLDNDAAGGGWYLDPQPNDDLEFPNLRNPFSAFSVPGMPGAPANPASRSDLYTVALHEVGHALGFAKTSTLWNRVNRNNFVLRFADGSTASFETDGVHTDDVQHPNDLMNPGISRGERRLISDLDARILGEIYGYSVDLADAQQESFIATLDPATNRLTVQGDLGTSYDDIRVDVFPGGYVIANVNGRIKRFDQSVVSSILVFGKGGNDDIRIGATAVNQPLTINAGGGTNFVYLSYSAFHLNTIQGDVTVFEEGGQTNVHFNDERNSAPRSISVGTDFVTFSGSHAVLNYRFVDPNNNLYGMILRGGSGGNAYSIFNKFSSTIIRVVAGAGSDTVEVKATKGAINVDGVGGLDRVTIGRSGSEGVSEILGSVYVSNSNFYTDLVIDDTNNNFSKNNVRIRDTEVSGLTPVPILFDPRGIRSLSVKVGSDSGGAGNTIHVLNTPQNRVKNLQVSLNSGRNADTVNVLGTTSPLTVNGAGGHDTVNVGQVGRVQGITGTLTIMNSGGHSAVNVSNFSDAVARTMILYNNGTYNVISGLGSADINVRGGELSALTIRLGDGGNAIRIHDTPAGMAPINLTTTLRTGRGNDQITVNGTTGGLILNALVGTNAITVGSATTGLNAINAPIYISGPFGSNTLRVNDGVVTTGRQYVVDRDFVQRLDKARIGYQDLARLILDAGSGQDTVDVLRTLNPVVIDGHGGGDTVNLGLDGDMGGLFGAPTIQNLGPSSQTLHLNNWADEAFQTVTMFLDPQNGFYIVKGLSPTNIRFKDVGALEISTGDGGSNYTIDVINRSSLNVSIIAGNGNDTFNVIRNRGELRIDPQAGRNDIVLGSAQYGLGNVRGLVTIVDGAGAESLTIIDTPNTIGRRFEVTDTLTSITETPDGIVTRDLAAYSSLAGYRLRSGAGNDVFKPESMPGFNGTIDGGGGVNTLDYSEYTVGLDPVISGRVSWYQGNGDFSDAIGGNDGTPHNGPTFAPGRVGDAISLDGVDDYIQVPNDQNLESANISVEVWLKSTNPSIFGSYVLSKGSFGSYALYTGDGNVGFYVSNSETAVEAPTSANIWDGNWHHVVGTFDGATVRLFVDGGEVGNGTPTDISITYGLPGSNDLFIGGTDPLVSDSELNYGGLIDDLSIYNRALSAAEIQSLYAPASAIAGLVSWYQGEGDFSDAVGGNHGTQVGGVAFDPGQIGQAFSFDDNYMSIPNAPNLEPTSVSVEAWVNSWIDDQHNRYILAKGANGITAASYALYTGPSGGLSFYVYDGDLNYVESPVAGTEIWDDTWHHVVGTYDGETVRLYVDGVEVGDGTPTSLEIGYGLLDSNDLYLGAYPGPSLLSFVGRIDEPSIYNRALGPSEVESLFTNGKSALSSDGVTVNLLLGTATGIPGGIANIQNVIGSAGDDILVGNGGNVLSGGAGRDFLIAGAFASSLVGGDGDDILIAGTTNYDADPFGLQAILAEWTSASDYATRVANLANGANGAPLLDATTVQSNGGGNTLDGNGGLDYFFNNMDDLDTLYGDPLTETFVAV